MAAYSAKGHGGAAGMSPCALSSAARALPSSGLDVLNVWVRTVAICGKDVRPSLSEVAFTARDRASCLSGLLRQACSFLITSRWRSRSTCLVSSSAQP